MSVHSEDILNTQISNHEREKKEMLSKWEWIAKACELNEFEKSMIIAIELENLLKNLYGDTKTKRWKEDYKHFISFSVKNIDRVIWECEYCIGCEHSCENDLCCGDCLLTLEDFRCGSEKSLFNQFCTIYKKETNHLKDLDWK